MIILAEYGVALTLRFPVIKAGSQDFADSADWTPATGDTKLSKDGGNVANATNNPSLVGGSGSKLWSLALTAAELQAQEVVVQIVDSATKAVEDQSLIVQTYGNASARHKVNLNDSVRAGLTALPNAAAEAAGGLYTRGSGAGQINQPANGQVDVNVERWNATLVPAEHTAGYPIATIKAGTGTGEVDTASGRVKVTEAQIDQIVDELWDEDVDASHQTAGSAGKKLDDAGTAGSPPSAATIAGAVWDEALAGHTASGSAGERLGRLPNSNAGSSGGLPTLDAGLRVKVDVERWQNGTPNALISGRVDANAQVVGDKTGYALTVSPPAAGAIAGAVWDEALAGHLTSGSTGAALDAALGGSVSGPGALERTIGVTVAGNPLQGAAVWVATDAVGSNVIAGPLTTDSFGEVTVLLDAGSYYAWVRLDGYNPIAGAAIEVS